MKKITLIGIAILASAVFATSSALDSVTGAVGQLCCGLTNMLPIVSMLMTILGAVIYAAGQMMGAETRARSNVWATAAITGALVSMLIFAVTPPMLQAVYNKPGTDMQTACQCNGVGGNGGNGNGPVNPGVVVAVNNCGDSGGPCALGTTCCTTQANAYLGCCLNGQTCSQVNGCEGVGRPN